MDRRHFLRTTTTAALAFGFADRAAAALEAENVYRKNIGIQRYTLRNQIGKDAAGTLKQVAEAGYKQVELYGFPNADAMVKGAKDAGVVHCHVEQDQSPDAIASIRQSLKHLGTL